MLSSSAIQNLTKYASKDKKAISYYKKKPTKANKKKLIKALKVIEEDNPVHMQGGYYKDTKMTLDRANEMIDRGNEVRGVLTKYLGVPAAAISDTMLSPVRAVGRAVSPYTNLAFYDVDELKSLEDPKKVIRAAKELAPLLKEVRSDPTGNWERLKDLSKNFINNTESQVSDTVTQVALGGVPVVADAAADVLNAPHTLLFNKLKWNGESREDYIRKKKKKK